MSCNAMASMQPAMRGASSSTGTMTVTSGGGSAAMAVALAAAERQHREQRPGGDQQVEAHRLSLDVVQVVGQLDARSGQPGTVAIVHLRPAREPGPDGEPSAVEVDLAFQRLDILRLLGTR